MLRYGILTFDDIIKQGQNFRRASIKKIVNELSNIIIDIVQLSKVSEKY